jgi:hypothetical protein
MAGNVYVFNATPNTMSLFLNQHLLKASVQGVQQSNSYAPTPISVPRNPADNPGVAQFGSTNDLVVSFDAGGAQDYTVPIDPNTLPITADLQLYIFFNEVVLVSPTGSGTASVISGSPTSSEKLSQLEAQAETQPDGSTDH